MLIRSQGKKHLIEMNKIIIQASGTDVICYDTSCIADEGYICLGKYESEAKAMKVLDMIQEAYSEYQIMLNFSVSYLHEFKEKTDGFAIFQMPEDSEVEV
nr:MAG TPA: hypothetical protein [Bacteriophage sp.]